MSPFLKVGEAQHWRLILKLTWLLNDADCLKESKSEKES
jgi:hypothetical protein